MNVDLRHRPDHRGGRSGPTGAGSPCIRCGASGGRLVGAALRLQASLILLAAALAACGGTITATPTPVANQDSTPTPARSLDPAATPASAATATPESARLSLALFVTARDVSGDVAPVGATDTFPADASRVYVVSHFEGGSGKADAELRWVAVDVDGYDPGAVIAERSVEVAAGDRHSFSLDAPGAGFPTGTYRADLSINGEPAGSLTFAVVAGDHGAASPMPQPNERVGAVLARDVTADYEPVDATTSFPPDVEKIHLAFRTEDLPLGTRLEAVWIAEQVEADVPPGYEIDRASLTVDGSRSGHFSLSRPTNGFPEGEYRVELYLDGTLIGVYEFSIIHTT